MCDIMSVVEWDVWKHVLSLKNQGNCKTTGRVVVLCIHLQTDEAVYWAT